MSPAPQPPAGQNLQVEDCGAGGSLTAQQIQHVEHLYTTAPPAAVSPGAPPRQIPSPPGDFVGREDEIGEILDHLNDRGATISGVRGMGGIGKTALAYVIAEKLKPKFEAHFYLDLKGSDEKPLAPSDAQAHVLRGYQPEAKLPDEPAQLTGLYRSVLSERPALLMMDNAADKGQVEPLIPPAGCVLLVTSRQHFELPGWFAKDLNTLPVAKARELLVGIAPRVAPTGDTGRRRLDKITELCCLLPLAVRLAGGALAKRPDLTPEAYMAKLEDERGRLDELDEARAVILTSAALLDESTRRLWRLLGVFGGDFDKAAAAAVWELDESAADDSIGTLLEFSLLEWSEETRRYRLHDLVRLAARGRLDEDGAERHPAELRFATHYKNVLAGAETMYLAGGEQVVTGLALSDLEAHNIEAAFGWCAARSAEDDDAARLCSAILDAGVYCFALREHPRKIIEQRQAALAAARRLNDRGAESRHLGTLGLAHVHLGEPRRAIEFYEQHIEIARETGDRRGEGISLGNLGNAWVALNEPRRAIKCSKQTLEIMREIGDRRGEGAALGNLGVAYHALGEYKRAIESCKRALEPTREIGDRRGEGHTLGNLGNAYAALGEPRSAIEFYGQQLEITRELGDQGAEAGASWNIGDELAKAGETARAVELMQVYVDYEREIGHPDAEKDAARVAELRRQLASK